MEKRVICPKKPPRKSVKLNIENSWKSENNLRSRRSPRKPLLRTPSQLYHFLKPNLSLNEIKEGKPSGDDVQIYGPEFIVRSKQVPRTVNLVKADHKNLEDSRKVTVVKLSGERLEIICDPLSTFVSDIYEILVADEEGKLLQPRKRYLGLAKLFQGEFYFLPLNTKLKKIAPKGWKKRGNGSRDVPLDNFTLYLRFVFYPRLDSDTWTDKVLTRNLYLQLRHDLINGFLYFPTSCLLELASLALQAEFGFVDKFKGEYFLLEHFLPQSYLQSSTLKSESIRSHLRQLHSTVASRKVSREEAKVMFVLEAQKKPHTGIHFYQVMMDSKNKCWLGINMSGLYVLRNPPCLEELELESSLSWTTIKRFSQSSSSLLIYSKEKNQPRKLKLKFSIQERCQFVLYVLKLFHETCQPKFNDEGPANSVRSMNQISGETIKEMSEVEVVEGDSNGCDDSTAGGDSLPFTRFRGCRNWWKVSRGSFGRSATPSTASSCRTSSRSSSAVGGLPSPNREPNVDRKRASNALNYSKEEFERLIDESFSICDSPAKESYSDVSVSRSVHKKNFEEDLSEITRKASKIQVGLGTAVFKHSFPQLTTPTQSPLKSTSRSLIGVRMGTKVPNALLNKHKFYGLESPPVTPSKNQGPGYFSPIIVEPEVGCASEAFNETVNESLFSRFLKAPTIAGSSERRLTTVKLLKENGSLGLLLGVGSDGALYIQGLTPGGPADRQSQLKPGDRLVGVNGLCVDSLSYGHTIELLRQAPESVSLLVSQPLSPTTDAPNLIEQLEGSSSFRATNSSSPSPPDMKYVTVIPINAETEGEFLPTKYTPKGYQFLFQEEV